MNDIYKSASATIAECVSMSDIFAVYGVEVNRQGFALCPFHNEKTPSMKSYRGEKRFKCFGCGLEGDVISFVREIEDIDFSEAVRKIDAMFNLRLFEKPTLRQYREIRKRINEIQSSIERKKELKQKADDEYWAIFDEWKRLDDNFDTYRPKSPSEELHPLFVEALHKKAYVEHLLDIADTERRKYDS